MKDQLIIHIGLGKAASSSLQAKIFPLISKSLGYYHISNKSPITDEFDLNLKNQLTKHITNMLMGFEVDKISFPEYTIVSNEGLSSYRQPQFYEEFAQKNLEAFGSSAHIILILRKPSEFLNSIYIQCCVHEKPIQEPEYFFLKKKNFSTRYPNSVFCIDDFDYNKLIDYYRKRFRKLTVIKFESINNANNLQKIFNFDNKLKNQIVTTLQNLNVNKSLGKRGIKFLKLYNKLFSILGLNYIPNYSNRILLSRMNDFNKIETLKQKKLNFKILTKISKIFMKPFFIDKLFGYQKNFLNFQDLEIDVNKLDCDYQKILDYQYFEN